MDKVFHLLVLYGNLYTLEQREKFGQYQWEQDLWTSFALQASRL